MRSRKAKLELVERDVHEGRGEPAPSVPASATKADASLIDSVVEQIRGILAKTVARGMDEVGQQLLREFFNNDPALYSSTSDAKHASLRLLLDRCETMDLPVRRTFLGNALQMAVFTRQLPQNAAFLQLPPSHRVELLRLGSPDKAESLAASAVDKKMTVQKVREVVRKERSKSKSTRGRKPTPTLLKALGVCVRNMRDESTGRLSFRRDDVEELTEEQLAEARDMAETLTKRVEELVKLLG